MRVPFVFLKMSISTTVCPATTVLEPPDGPSLGEPAGETVGVGLSVGEEVGVGVADGDGELNSWAKGSRPLNSRICDGLTEGLGDWLAPVNPLAGPGEPSAEGVPPPPEPPSTRNIATTRTRNSPPPTISWTLRSRKEMATFALLSGPGRSGGR